MLQSCNVAKLQSYKVAFMLVGISLNLVKSWRKNLVVWTVQGIKTITVLDYVFFLRGHTRFSIGSRCCSETTKVDGIKRTR